MPEWKRHATGWIDERNFEIDLSQIPEGYLTRVSVIGFSAVEDGEVYRSAEAAQEAALQFLQKQFPGKVTLGE